MNRGEGSPLPSSFIRGDFMKNKYEIQGETTVIKVKCRGEILDCLIDTEDLPLVDKYTGTWYVHMDDSRKYVKINHVNSQGKRQTIQLHRVILGARPGWVVDHRNHNELDNRKHNIWECSQEDNMKNKTSYSRSVKNTSGIPGVVYISSTGKWRARTQANGTRYSLGVFDSKEEAGREISRFLMSQGLSIKVRRTPINIKEVM